MISAALEIPGFSDGELPGRVRYARSGFGEWFVEFLDALTSFLESSAEDLIPPPEGGPYFSVRGCLT